MCSGSSSATPDSLPCMTRTGGATSGPNAGSAVRLAGLCCEILRRLKQKPPSLKTSLLDRMVTAGLSSVDVENFSSHESRRVQVHYRVHDVRHFSHSADRM